MSTIKAMWHDYGAILFWVLLLAVVCLAVYWVVGLVFGATGSFISGIDSPVERGMAYVAIAIALHAFVHRHTVTVEAPR